MGQGKGVYTLKQNNPYQAFLSDRSLIWNCFKICFVLSVSAAKNQKQDVCSYINREIIERHFLTQCHSDMLSLM